MSEDFPEVAAYLGSLNAPVSQQIAQVPTQNLPSQHAQNIASETLTTSLLESVHDIMQRADAEGRDPDEELRQVVGRTVLEGVAAGYDMSAEASDIRHSNIESPGGTKRSRTDGDS